MASSFEKSVKGATKIKLAPPKTKYIEHILVATHSGEAGVGEVFRALQNRLRDSTWTVVFKSLITVHLMIREGSPDVTLAYLGKHRNMLAVSMFSDAQTQGRNIRHYANYLSERARAYRETKCDWVRAKEDRLEKLTVDKGLLRETETVQHQLTALLKCDVLENEPENEITITVFRLLVLDLLALFQVLNQAMINILGHFFEMSKTDAERAMDIYRTFTRQTDFVVQYLSVARQYEHHTRVEVPKLKHAPVNLGRQLEEYLKDPDFEIHRRQYLAELEAKKKGGSSGAKLFGNGASRFDTAKATSSTNGAQQTAKPASAGKATETNLIDFFESIEQNQTPMATQPQPQAQAQLSSPWAANSPFQAQPTAQFQTNGFVPQQIPQQTGFQPGFQSTSPFQQQSMTAFSPQPQQQQSPTQPLQPSFTGAGFGGFTPQPGFQPNSLGSIPQDSVANFQTGAATGFSSMSPQQTTNPFRASMMMAQQTGQVQPNNTLFSPTLQQRPSTSQSTNPFARASPQTGQQTLTSPGANTSPFQSAAPATTSSFQSAVPATTSPFQSPPPQAAPLLPMATGTNPFQKNYAPPQPQLQPQQQRPVTAGGLLPQATGTNPFRQGPIGNQNTGWQNNQPIIGGGLDQVPTIPVFPRTGQQQSPWQT